MKSTYRIAVSGIGGVGGYLGALLSGASLNPNIEVVLITRGENFRVVKSQGIKLTTDNGESIVRPPVVTDTPSSVGRIDLLLCCVKSFDLEQSLKALLANVTGETVILPLLNGVNAAEKIKTIYPTAKVWKGAIYLVSRLSSPGVIRQSGTLNQLFFGSCQASSSELEFVENIFHTAGIKAQIAEDMELKLWEKFFFISALATITSYYNCSIGKIQTDLFRMAHLRSLLTELENIAAAGKIVIPPDLTEKTFLKIKCLPPETTSSLLSDFRKGGKTEIEELTGSVVHMGEDLGVPTPVYDMMFAKLKHGEIDFK